MRGVPSRWSRLARGGGLAIRGAMPGAIRAAMPGTWVGASLAASLGATLRAILVSRLASRCGRFGFIMLPRRGEACGLARARRATTAVEFAVAGLALVLIVIGFVEFGLLTWSFEVLQEVAVQGARCMGLGVSSCRTGGVYSSTSTTSYIVALASTRGVVITSGMVTLNATATCGGTTGFSQVSISYSFATVAPTLLTSLTNGFTVPVSACFPNHT